MHTDLPGPWGLSVRETKPWEGHPPKVTPRGPALDPPWRPTSHILFSPTLPSPPSHPRPLFMSGLRHLPLSGLGSLYFHPSTEQGPGESRAGSIGGCVADCPGPHPGSIIS